MANSNIDTRTTNSKRNIYAGVINRCIMMILPLITRTVMLQTLGKSYLGIGSLFSSILKVLNLTELGFGSALVFSMYKPIAEKDNNKICALLQLYKKIYHIIGTVILLGGLCLLPFLSYIIKGGWPEEVNIYIIYCIYLVNSSVSYFAFAYKRALLTAYQKTSVITNANTVFSIVSYGLQIGLLFLIHNYYVYVLLLPFFAVVENIYLSHITDKYYPELKCHGTISKEEKLVIKDHVKGIALQKICSTSRNSFDSIVVSMFIGLVAIGIYNNYYQIMISVHTFLYIIPNAIRASAGNSVAKESVAKNYDDFRKFNFLYLWIGTWCCTCLVCLFQPFMKIWMGDDMLLPYSSVILFCIYFFELCMSDMLALYKDAAGLWWYGRYRTVIEAAANFILGYYFGINGILFATVFTIFAFGIIYGGYIVFRYYFADFSILKYLLTLLFSILFTAIICIGTFFVCSFINCTGVILFLLRGIVCVILPNIIMFLLYFRTRIFRESLMFVKSIVSK